MKTAVFILALSVLLSGCAQTAPEPAKFEIKGDTYCDIARKISWSQNDTAETVKQILRENAKVDRVCGIKTTS